MLSASFLFLLFLYFGKFTSGNILETGRKFTGNFYVKKYTTTSKGDLGGHPGARDDPLPRPHLEARVGPDPAPWTPPRPPPTPIKSLLT